MRHDEDPIFLPCNSVAQRLGLPTGWLLREAKEGRVPHILAGRRIFLSVDLVREALEKRAREENP